MAVDFTALLDKLNPDPGGESVLRLRAGTVAAVNANGTLDITMSSGIVVAGVHKLATAYAPVGANVQMIAQRGSLLVIGAVGSGGANGAMTKTGSHSGGPTTAASYSVANISFGVTFPAAPNVHINVNSGAGNAASWVPKAINVTTTKFDLLAHGPASASGFTAAWQWTAILAP
jgi:hypothetical protein